LNEAVSMPRDANTFFTAAEHSMAAGS